MPLPNQPDFLALKFGNRNRKSSLRRGLRTNELDIASLARHSHELDELVQRAFLPRFVTSRGAVGLPVVKRSFVEVQTKVLQAELMGPANETGNRQPKC